MPTQAKCLPWSRQYFIHFDGRSSFIMVTHLIREKPLVMDMVGQLVDNGTDKHCQTAHFQYLQEKISRCYLENKQELCLWNTMPPTALWSRMAAILETRLYFECKGHSDLDLWPSDLKPCLIVDVNEMHAHVKFKEHRPKSNHSKCAALWDAHAFPFFFFFFYLWPWRMTLTFHHSKCAASWDAHACQISSCHLQYCKSYDGHTDRHRRTDRRTVQICVHMERPCSYTHAYQIWRLYLKRQRSYEHFSKL